jgi:hypothetical protein
MDRKPRLSGKFSSRGEQSHVHPADYRNPVMAFAQVHLRTGNEIH